MSVIQKRLFPLIAAFLLSACSGSDAEKLANPASQHCLKSGGQVEFKNRGPAGEYGVCLFKDDRRCEQQAMLDGRCPKGGIDVKGLVTVGAQYCGMTGGVYETNGIGESTEKEQGTCRLPGGKQCDVWAYYGGGCQ